MINKINDYMVHNKMIGPGGRILAAVSGGADSMCLLEVLRQLQSRAGFRLRVLHVHHGLRENAEGDLQYVSDYCETAGIPFRAVRVDAAGHAAEQGLSLEEAARHLRYEALEEAAEEWDREEAPEAPGCRIAVAHHMEDQAETVLFNLVRGSRLTGLRGMLAVNGRIIRPLLPCSRPQIEEFLNRRGIAWREDETNEDVRYARNLVRREIMPLLRQINAGAAGHIARAAGEAAEVEEFLQIRTRRALAACHSVRTLGEARQPGTGEAPTVPAGEPRGAAAGKSQLHIVSIPELMREEPLIRRRVVYAVIAEAAGRKKDLQDIHVQDVLRLALKEGNGRLDVLAGLRVEKLYDKLLFCSGSPAPAVTGRRWPMRAEEYSTRVFDFDGDLSAVPRKQYTKWLDYDKIGAFPSFRTRCEGDRITLDESGRSKTIARYMIDTKVPAKLRDRIVLPASGNEILWIPAAGPEPGTPIRKAETATTSFGGRMSAACKVSSSTRRILEIRWNPDGAPTGTDRA